MVTPLVLCKLRVTRRPPHARREDGEDLDDMTHEPGAPGSMFYPQIALVSTTRGEDVSQASCYVPWLPPLPKLDLIAPSPQTAPRSTYGLAEPICRQPDPCRPPRRPVARRAAQQRGSGQHLQQQCLRASCASHAAARAKAGPWRSPDPALAQARAPRDAWPPGTGRDRRVRRGGRSGPAAG